MSGVESYSQDVETNPEPQYYAQEALPVEVGIFMGPDDKPRLQVCGRDVLIFPAGSYSEVCAAFNFGGFADLDAPIPYEITACGRALVGGGS